MEIQNNTILLFCTILLFGEKAVNNFNENNAISIFLQYSRDNAKERVETCIGEQYITEK
jgi:hypothetical protein